MTYRRLSSLVPGGQPAVSKIPGRADRL